MNRSLVFLLGLFVTAISASAEIVVNEVLANEPGGLRNLEWIELHADSCGAEALDRYELHVDDSVISFPADLSLGPDQYLVICRRLFGSSSTSGFESFWGDSSGEWGDCPEESTLLTPVELEFALKNTAGTVGLYRDDLLISAISWNDDGGDGVSWERLAPTGASIVQSVDLTGSTPGCVNSLTPVRRDLALSRVSAEIEAGLTRLIATVMNRGLEAVSEAHLTIFREPEHSVLVDQVLDPLNSGDSMTLTEDFYFDSMYTEITIRLSADDKPRNNRLTRTVPGEYFPPFVLSEVLVTTESIYGGQWVEIVNCLSEAFDLCGWRLGDARVDYVIVDTSVFVAPGELIVVAESETDFYATYGDIGGIVLEPSSWPHLNQGGDSARLLDPHDLAADLLDYRFTFDGNHSWCREPTANSDGEWGRSETSGGTPGEPNRVVLNHDGASLELDISPAVFSPDGDGFEDQALITISGPDVTATELKIYDRQGRIVREFDTGDYRLNQYAWDGCTAGGSRLPIGVYVVYCEVSGAGSVKKAVVIAR